MSDLAHHYFSRCLTANIVPYVVTKKTVFKWQEGFWTIMKDVFDKHYKDKYIASGLIPDGNLKHLISDAATMQVSSSSEECINILILSSFIFLFFILLWFCYKKGDMIFFFTLYYIDYYIINVLFTCIISLLNIILHLKSLCAKLCLLSILL